jgi:hypothetical protein
MIAHGPLDRRAHVMTCARDARCCNPSHLFLLPHTQTPLRRGEGAHDEAAKETKPPLTAEETRAALVANHGDLTRAARSLGRSRQRFADAVRRLHLGPFAAELRYAARGFSGPGRPPASDGEGEGKNG